VAFATGEEFCPRVERIGFDAFPAGIGLDAQREEARRRFPEEAGLPPSQERFLSFVPRMLAGVAAPSRASDLVAIVEDWKPDVLVHDETELAGPIAAAVAGIPYAGHSVGILRPPAMAELAARTIAPLWRKWGLEPCPTAGLFRYLYLDICPPVLQSSTIDDIPVAHHVRPTFFDATRGERLPHWVHDLPPVPTVYVTLGTVFNRDPTVFATIVEGVRQEAVNVVVTVGTDNDPCMLGPQPDNVHVERYIAESALLPHCDLVITHGGTGSMVPALAQGLPVLLVPQGANQFHNAEACVGAGAGRCLPPDELCAEAVRREVRTLFADPSYRARARQIEQEIEAMPSPLEGVRLLERLHRERRPLHRREARGALRPKSRGDGFDDADR
jgi:UDP:flavonoid glycosyltransferase YjiC (YdhE family)